MLADFYLVYCARRGVYGGNFNDFDGNNGQYIRNDYGNSNNAPYNNRSPQNYYYDNYNNSNNTPYVKGEPNNSISYPYIGQ